jgi:hypothetical protein
MPHVVVVTYQTYCNTGWDADIVVWDSHPLALGATPKQVYIDGIPQLNDPFLLQKPESFQKTPGVPNFDEETKETIAHDGLPPLRPHRVKQRVLLTNVSSVHLRTGSTIEEMFTAASGAPGSVLIDGGHIKCAGVDCSASGFAEDADVIDLRGGSIQPSLTTYGSPLGLLEIESERSTADGVVLDPLVGPVPKVLGGEGSITRAGDGLIFDTRDQW